MRNLVQPVYVFAVLLAASGSAIAAAPPALVETGTGIRSATLTEDGMLDIHIHSGLRGYGDRTGHSLVTVSARTEAGEEQLRRQLPLHRGQTYQHVRVSEDVGGERLIWTVELTDY